MKRKKLFINHILTKRKYINFQTLKSIIVKAKQPYLMTIFIIFFTIIKLYLKFHLLTINFKKKKCRFFERLFDENQKHIYELEKEIKINDGKLFVITYELDEDIAIAYLPKGITIDFGYIKSEQKFYLTIYKNGDWNNQLEAVEVNEIQKIKDLLQNLINKYSV